MSYVDAMSGRVVTSSFGVMSRTDAKRGTVVTSAAAVCVTNTSRVANYVSVGAGDRLLISAVPPLGPFAYST